MVTNRAGGGSSRNRAEFQNIIDFSVFQFESKVKHEVAWYRHDFLPEPPFYHNGDTATQFQTNPTISIGRPRDLESRLARRRSVEAQHHRGARAHGDGDFALHHERVMAWGLKTALRISGLYRSGLANALRPVVRELRLEIETLPADLDGFRILHLSDFHIDRIDGLAEALAERLAFLPVDLCVLTGDYRFDVDGPCDAVYPRMRRVLSAIRSRHGVVGILGNHDCADIAIGLEALGVRMLINESVAIGSAAGPLWVIGVDDPHFFGCDDLKAAARDVPEGGFQLLLAHTPEMYREAAAAGIDLYLSGHTHAGQIRLPGIGALVQLADCPREFAFGQWNYKGMTGYTTAGVGCSLLPVRFNCPPEIVVIELRRS